ncbi:MAG TPA: CCA tRNA nucleotidyltransferase [Egibacteraceae bacterium]|nr:CCA tRNA nucleotidyltransferase [Egibacteraceae bacterium]
MATDDLTAEQHRRLAELVAVYPVADELGRRMADSGHELYLVGGTVRDTLLHGRASGDLDFATSAPPEETERVLEGWADAVWLTGARFGTVSARKNDWHLEITTFRADVYEPGSRRPEVTYGRDIEADLARRDFTCNAMAVRLAEHRFVDPFRGLADLQAGVLRTPVDAERSFGDDPLRMVRLARFAAVLGAEPDESARKAATVMAAQIDTISRERIRVELDKLVTAPEPRRGMDLLCDTGLAQRFLPELPALRMEHDPLHHHKDVYAHTMAVVEGCPADDRILRLAALLHDIGKPATREFHPDGKVTFHHHEVVGARMARERMRALTYAKDDIEAVAHLVHLHLRFHGYSDQAWTDSAVRRYVRDAGDQLARLNQLTRADVTTRNQAKARRLARAMDDLEQRIARLDAEERIAQIRPPLDGNAIMAHLGLEPGPAVGRAREMLLEARLDRGPMTEEEAYRLLDEWAAAQER